MKLIAPNNYYTASKKRQAEICNGTGAAGTPKWLVTLLDSCDGWGVNYRPAANIHDWMYFYGKYWYQKIIADIVFLLNMIIIAVFAICQKPFSRLIGNLIMFPLRIARAFIYFLAVLLFGWRPFYS